MLTIFTLAIGKDYCRNLAEALQSKKDYAARHGYTYIQGDETYWNRDRPIAWSKVPFLIEHLDKLPEGAIIWMSDADVYITNPSLRVEDHVLPLLPAGKDMLISMDACGHINSGNLFMRNTAWLRDYWRRVWNETDCIYHIWWENKAMIQLMERNAEDRAHIEVSPKHKIFNAFVMGLDGQPLWEHGDFLVHFAGIYSTEKMKQLIQDIKDGKTPRVSMF